jgi:3-isopropylmalate dehydrogenase
LANVCGKSDWVTPVKVYGTDGIENLLESSAHLEFAIKAITRPPARLSDAIFDDRFRHRPIADTFTIGVLEGEGIGHDVVGAALRVLSALEHTGRAKIHLQFGGLIGQKAEAIHGKALSEEVVSFCRGVFAEGGAILAGPGGGRFVYDLRKQFDLFCKLSPLKVCGQLFDSIRVKREYVNNVDILMVRENVAGIYQGSWTEHPGLNGDRRAEHSFSYTQHEVRRILEVSVRLASLRRGGLTVVIKDGGIPSISKLWRNCAAEICREAGVEHTCLNVDHVAYQLVQSPQQFDVIVTSNLFGDVLADLGGVLLGSRALGYSGNFSSNGSAVYQTSHGAGYDLVGKNQANPMGQIFSLAMLLRESFGLAAEAELVERAAVRVWQQGWRTSDLTNNGYRVAGTKEMGELVAEALVEISS